MQKDGNLLMPFHRVVEGRVVLSTSKGFIKSPDISTWDWQFLLPIVPRPFNSCHLVSSVVVDFDCTGLGKCLDCGAGW